MYRQSGYAAQWRKHSRKIRSGVRIDPIALQRHDVWCMDFAEDRLSTGRKMIALSVKNEATSFGLKITVQRSVKGVNFEAVLDTLVGQYGAPKYIRCDNGGQFIAHVVQFIAHVVQRRALGRSITLVYIQPGKPLQNGLAESFVGSYSRVVLCAEVLRSLPEAHDISNIWLHTYNTERPHSRHNYRPPITAFKYSAA